MSGLSDQKTLIVTAAVFLLLFLLGFIEKKQNDRNVRRIPIRINVNGIRGKSTATRLITAILNEAGYRTIGKTTGTEARMLYWGQLEEKILRKPRGVSLGEQVKVIKKAARLEADALVCECMAVKPEYQRVYQHAMLKGTMTVIVNVLEDHLDQMGPTTTQIAWSFADTIPYNGKTIIPDCEFTAYFQQVAKERNTEAYVIHDEEISDEYVKSFSYRLFAHNCAVALTAARALGIDDEISFRGMLKAAPDPGVLQIKPIGHNAFFVNGFAANDPSSTLEIWNEIESSEYNKADPIIVLNCRQDRVDRTKQFVNDFLPHIPNATILAIGEETTECAKGYKAGKYPLAASFHSIEGNKIPEIMNYLRPIMENRIVFGVGNIHGIGGDFIEALLSTNESNGQLTDQEKEA